MFGRHEPDVPRMCQVVSCPGTGIELALEVNDLLEEFRVRQSALTDTHGRHLEQVVVVPREPGGDSLFFRAEMLLVQNRHLFPEGALRQDGRDIERPDA